VPVADRDLGRERAAVAAVRRQLQHARRRAAAGGAALAVAIDARIPGEQSVEAGAQDLALAPAEHLLAGLVERLHLAMVVHLDQCIVRQTGDRAELFRRGAQFGLAVFELLGVGIEPGSEQAQFVARRNVDPVFAGRGHAAGQLARHAPDRHHQRASHQPACHRHHTDDCQRHGAGDLAHHRLHRLAHQSRRLDHDQLPARGGKAQAGCEYRLAEEGVVVQHGLADLADIPLVGAQLHRDATRLGRVDRRARGVDGAGDRCDGAVLRQVLALLEELRERGEARMRPAQLIDTDRAQGLGLGAAARARRQRDEHAVAVDREGVAVQSSAAFGEETL
jgi:hypothetical protein